MASAIAQHGYSILFTLVFLEAVGLPVPAALALLLAGGASATGSLAPGTTLLTALAAMLSGDLLMFLFGRYTGWWLLALLCRVSLNPEACILRSADSFYKRGRLLLVIAKFIPGINTMAPPMAGSMNMRFYQFLPLDIAGAVLYTAAYWSAGFLFSGFLGAMTRGYTTIGNTFGFIVVLLFAAYLANRLRLWIGARKLAPIKRITVPELAQNLANVAIYDARSHGYYDPNAMRIKGSTRLEPNALTQEAFKIPAGDKEIVLYCTCVREATSIRVARILSERGAPASVLIGGLRAWKRAGLPLEPVPHDDVIALPTFS